jgi:hypothetical protein
MAGHNAYIAYGGGCTDGVEVYDLTNPWEPENVGALDTADLPGGVAVVGDLVYVVGMNKFEIAPAQCPVPAGVDPEISLRMGTAGRAWPNPLYSGTAIGFSLARAGSVRLTIYDTAGREQRALTERLTAPGSHTIEWDGRDERGCLVPAGSYFYRVGADGLLLTGRIAVVR